MNKDHLSRLAAVTVQEQWQVKHPTQEPGANLQVMNEIRAADKLADIIWLPGTVALILAARAERDAWQQRAQQAEHQLAAAGARNGTGL